MPTCHTRTRTRTVQYTLTSNEPAVRNHSARIWPVPCVLLGTSWLEFWPLPYSVLGTGGCVLQGRPRSDRGAHQVRVTHAARPGRAAPAPSHP
eukprot:5981564-Prymnesium_polylepis.1